MLKTLGIALAATLCLSGAALAQGGPAPVRADRNADGRVSLAEMQARSADRFARQDVNRDGRLTREERRASRQARRGARNGQRRRGRAGQMAGPQSPALLQQRFAQLDLNRDGQLSPTEFAANWNDRRALSRQFRPGRARAAFRAPVDLNGDGVITRAEADAGVRTRFAQMDLNRDGYLTREERRAARAQRRG